MRSISRSPPGSNRHSSTRSALAENSAKFVPLPSQVAPSGDGAPVESRPLRLLITQFRPGLLQFDAGKLDDLGPLFGLAGDELAKIGRRACQRRATQIRKPRFHLGVGE